MTERRLRLSAEDRTRLEDMAREHGIAPAVRDDTKQHKMVAEERARKKAEALAQEKLAA